MGATLDLMVHDLDLLRQFIRTEPVQVDAAGSGDRSDGQDEVEARIVFACGAVADLTASRIAPRLERSMGLTYETGDVSFDFLERRIINRTDMRLDQPDQTSQKATDPLGYGVNSFIDSVRTGAPAAVSGRDGRRAVELAERIEIA
ncbi:MAG: gfo/Idh/MocA family oxidoreductase, partial [Pseudomonadota bacterium]